MRLFKFVLDSVSCMCVACRMGTFNVLVCVYVRTIHCTWWMHEYDAHEDGVHDTCIQLIRINLVKF
jgi:hypothetical protein